MQQTLKTFIESSNSKDARTSDDVSLATLDTYERKKEAENPQSGCGNKTVRKISKITRSRNYNIAGGPNYFQTDGTMKVKLKNLRLRSKSPTKLVTPRGR